MTLKTGQSVKVRKGILCPDDPEFDLYGVIASCKAGRRRYDFPLVDLAAIDEKSENARHIQDYRVWFANR